MDYLIAPLLLSQFCHKWGCGFFDAERLVWEPSPWRQEEYMLNTPAYLDNWVPDHRCFQAFETSIIAKASCNLPVFCGHVVSNTVHHSWFTKLEVCHTRFLLSSEHRCVKGKCTVDNARTTFEVHRWKKVEHRLDLQHGLVLLVESDPVRKIAKYWRKGKLHYTRPQCFRVQKEIPEMVGVDDVNVRDTVVMEGRILPRVSEGYLHWGRPLPKDCSPFTNMDAYILYNTFDWKVSIINNGSDETYVRQVMAALYLASQLQKGQYPYCDVDFKATVLPNTQYLCYLKRSVTHHYIGSMVYKVSDAVPYTVVNVGLFSSVFALFFSELRLVLHEILELVVEALSSAWSAFLEPLLSLDLDLAEWFWGQLASLTLKLVVFLPVVELMLAFCYLSLAWTLTWVPALILSFPIAFLMRGIQTIFYNNDESH